MRSSRLLWLSAHSLSVRPSVRSARSPSARTTAAVQEPAKQGPSGPLPVQAPPTPPPAAAEQNAQVAQQAAAVEGNPDWAVTLERIASSVVSIDVDCHPRLRYRVECNGAGHRVRGRCRARPDPHQPARRDSGARDGRGHLPQPRGSAALSGLSRPRARLRSVSLRSEQVAFHQAEGARPVSGRRADRPRDPRGRQQRRRAALHSRRHPGPPRPRCSRIRHRASTTTSTPSTPGRLRHLGRLFGLAGDRYPRPRRRAQRGRCERQCLQLLSAARPRAPRPRVDTTGQAGHPRHAVYGVQLHAV